jgi:hypothetical protein
MQIPSILSHPLLFPKLVLVVPSSRIYRFRSLLSFGHSSSSSPPSSLWAACKAKSVVEMGSRMGRGGGGGDGMGDGQSAAPNQPIPNSLRKLEAAPADGQHKPVGGGIGGKNKMGIRKGKERKRKKPERREEKGMDELPKGR